MNVDTPTLLNKSLAELTTLAENEDVAPREKSEAIEKLTNEILALATKSGGEEKEVVGGNDIRNQIGKMSMGEKIKTAMFGNSVARGLLIMDANKLIQQFVLKNPQLRIEEVVDFAKNPNTPKSVLRSIGEKNTWIKEYSLKQALVFNPKTPLDLSLKLFRYLNQGDLKKLCCSKNIPSALVQAANKAIKNLDKRR
jgi:hypothetical protein